MFRLLPLLFRTGLTGLLLWLQRKERRQLQSYDDLLLNLQKALEGEGGDASSGKRAEVRALRARGLRRGNSLTIVLP